MVNTICTIQQSYCSLLKYDNIVDIGRISVSHISEHHDQGSFGEDVFQSW